MNTFRLTMFPLLSDFVHSFTLTITCQICRLYFAAKYAASNHFSPLYPLPNTSSIPTALLNFVAKPALFPLAPAPVLPYSPNSTQHVCSLPVFQMLQPAGLMTFVMLVFWKTTRAWSRQGRPR